MVKFGVDEELVFTSKRDDLLKMMAAQMQKPAAAAAEMMQTETVEVLKLQLQMQCGQQAAQQKIQIEAERLQQA